MAKGSAAVVVATSLHPCVCLQKEGEIEAGVLNYGLGASMTADEVHGRGGGDSEKAEEEEEEEGLFPIEKEAALLSGGVLGDRRDDEEAGLNGGVRTTKRKWLQSMTLWRLMLMLGLGGIAIASLGSTIQQSLVTMDEIERNQLQQLNQGLGLEDKGNNWPQRSSDKSDYLPCVWGGRMALGRNGIPTASRGEC